MKKLRQFHELELRVNHDLIYLDILNFMKHYGMGKNQFSRIMNRQRKACIH